MILSRFRVILNKRIERSIFFVPDRGTHAEARQYRCEKIELLEKRMSRWQRRTFSSSRRRLRRLLRPHGFLGYSSANSEVLLTRRDSICVGVLLPSKVCGAEPMEQNKLRAFSGSWQEITRLLVATGGLLLLLLGTELLLLKHVDQLKYTDQTPAWTTIFLLRTVGWMSLATISVCILHTIISLATVSFYKSRSGYLVETAPLTASDALSYLAAVIALTVACALISRTVIAGSLISKLLFYVSAFVLILEVTILSIARAKHRLAPSATRAASLYGPARART
jgi:hypothetical protein